MHALAYDDGTHSDYALGGGAPLNVLHAAALTADGEAKGGPYTAGPLPGTAQYGILEVYDTGGAAITCRFLGMRVGEGAKLTYTFGSSAAAMATDPALVNISTLASVSAGNDVLTSGFVIGGRSPRNVLVRAAGPALSQFGVSDFVPRPTLTVFQNGKVIASNDGWAPTDEAATRLVAAFDRAGAFRFVDKLSRDSALLLTLNPGPYTIQVRSGTTVAGRALIEVYDVTQ